MAHITLKDVPIKIYGNLPTIGTVAPDFRLVDSDLRNRGLEDFGDRRKLISIVPSLDTPVCAESARAFNSLVSRLSNTVMIIVSADLPFAQDRFCTTEGLNNVLPLSMMRNRDFARDYGVLMTDGPLEGILARGVVVLDEQNRVLHSELVSELTREPNYEKVIQTLGAA